MTTITYTLVEHTNRDGTHEEGIKCLICNRTSYHPQDIGYRFCVGCDIFHDDDDIFKAHAYVKEQERQKKELREANKMKSILWRFIEKYL